MVLPDAEAAWYQAYRSGRELIRDDVWRGDARPGRFVEIKDEQGHQLWAVPFEDVAGVAA